MYYKIFLLTSCLSFMAFVSCNKDKVIVVPDLESSKKEVFNIFPSPTSELTENRENGSRGWVGDVMPYFYNGQFEIFFLHDAPDRVKQSSPGQHPIHKFTSNNLLDFTYNGEMIPYGSVNTQDHLIGTGSLVESNGVYYFYYTGHNGSSNWLRNNDPGWVDDNSREAIMYATSKDLNTWTKKEGFLLKASDAYSSNDFRDPYVFFNDEFDEYWMLVSTQSEGKGVILVYTTSDPASDDWQLKSPLPVEGDYLMLECADIFKLGDKYYMLFAEDWSNTPGTHYRVANSTAGPWMKPVGGMDMFDGHQFYAGRSASNGNSRFTFGWAHRRSQESDGRNLIWGGNLVTHEIFQLSNGKLAVKSPEPVQTYFTKDANLVIEAKNGNVNQENSNYILNGSESAAYYKFSPIDGTSKLQGNFTISNLTGNATIGFNTDENNISSYTIKLDPASNRIIAFNNGIEVTRVPFQWEVNKTYKFSLVIDGSICVLYLNDEVALTNRIYGMQGNSWSLSAEMLELNLKNLKISHH